ncbi:polysaccharide biosynthesis tyrosine autokinase [Methylosinus sp. H3A]|uniref:GumC family protein n=1 Tax=Methylosinus sp. H3A TaxID=2785786 RepID=UPI0018C21B33|nr:polysaccharide biosynthesis tyrosine autokinase [Methylosinus sp. H3A]MBG0809349.1 polysaccharide biosynthesis tyrosine autokinase [Methylosinus sp. H3A]
MGSDHGPETGPSAVALDAAHSERAVAAGRRYPAVYDERLSGFDESSGASSFLKYVGLLVKHRILVAAICVSALLFGFVVTFLTPRIYTATTTIQIDREAAKIVRLQDPMVERTDDPQFYTTQYELLKSHALAERVVSSLALADKKEFAEAEASIVGRLLQKLFTKREDAEPDNARRRRQAIDMVMKGLMIQPVSMSRIVKVNFSSPSPALAQQISVAIAENFVAMTLDRRYSASNYARNFLEEKLQQVKLKLEDSEKQVVAYAQKEGIVSVDDKLSIAGSNLKSLNDTLGVAMAQRIKEEQLWIQAQNGTGLGLPQVLDDRNIQRARERRTELMADYQDKLGVMKPDFPEMRQLRSQIAEYDRQIREQVDFIRQAIRARYEAARDQEMSFSRRIETLKVEALDLRDRSIKYNILQREVDTNRSLYDGLLQQYKEVGVTGAIGTNNVSVIDKAERPKSPSSPKLLMNLSSALVFGVIASIVTIAVREFLDDTFKVPEEIEEALGLTVLGVIPLAKRDKEKSQDRAGYSVATEIIGDPLSPMAEAYRSLRTSIQFSTATGAPRTLLVTSSQPGEGKSTTSVCIAANFAQLGMQVLLIDADMRKPSLHEILAVDNNVGLTNVLTGAMDASAAVYENRIFGVTFMASGPVPPNPAELLAGPRFGSLLAMAREKFDIVVIDGPPVVGLADAPLLGSLVDGAIFVVDAMRTRRRVVRAAVKRLDFARTRLLGGLLNKFDAKNVGHSYGYAYGDAYGQGHAYGNEYFGYGAKKAQSGSISSMMEQ